MSYLQQTTNSEHNLIPVGQLRSYPVTSAVSALSVGEQATHVMIQAQGGTVRWRVDGGNNVTVAWSLPDGAYMTLHATTARKLRFARNDEDCVLVVQDLHV